MVYAFCSYYSTVKCKISHLRIVLSRQSPFLSILIKRSEFTNLLAPFSSSTALITIPDIPDFQYREFLFSQKRILFSICF